MDFELSALHFLRPVWLLILPAALLLGWIWMRRNSQARAFIAPELLPHLIVRQRERRGLQPIHLLLGLLTLGSIAAAGPAWQREAPAFLDDTAPLIVALDLSPSMDANDVLPTRIEAARHKLHDLVAARPGARTGLMAYAGSAHLVLPPTTDAEMLKIFIDALGTGLIAKPGRDVAATMQMAGKLLAAEGSGGSLLLMTDGAASTAVKAAPDLQVMVLAIGQRNVGTLLDGQGQPLQNAGGAQVLDDFDAAAIRAMADKLGAPLAGMTADSSDLDWIKRHAQRHYQAAQDQGAANWKDAGYWLCIPLVLAALLTLRRNWSVAWMAAFVFVLAGGAPAPVQAGALADAFFTPDQQGQRAYDRGHYDQAARLFNDLYWKGRAAYAGGNYAQALSAFARLRTPEGYFYQGNTQLRLHHYDAAQQAYKQALALRPDWQEAAFNLRIVEGLLAAMQQEDSTQMPQDQSVVDKSGIKGQGTTQTPQKTISEENWLRNLSLSPAQFLRGKFAIEDAGGQP